MAAKRERPFAQFNFLVDLGTGNTDGPEAGFQECSNIGMEVAVAEYRNGNDKLNSATATSMPMFEHSWKPASGVFVSPVPRSTRKLNSP